MDAGQVLLALFGLVATALLGWIKADVAQIRRDIATERERGHAHALRLAMIEERISEA
jgi:hypothetical protein